MGYCAISILSKPFLPSHITSTVLNHLFPVGQHGGGYHITDLSTAEIIQFKKFCYIATILYCPMALSVKIALLSILTRIFAPYRGKVWFIYILLGCLCIYYFVALVIKIRICDPIPLYWLGKLPDGSGSCLDQAAALIADSVISVVSDIIILILPLPLTWSLQMSRNKKLRVMGLLGAGGLATAFSLYRLVLVLKEGNSPDQTIVFICVILSGYDMSCSPLPQLPMLTSPSNAEGGVGLICACLPILNVLFVHYRKNYSSQRYYNRSSDVQLGDRKSGNNSTSATLWEPSSKYGDQSHLISFAGTPDASGSTYMVDGIRKTVAVSQTVESADGDSR